MSVHDEGYGDNARPTFEFESDFANRFRSVGAEGDKSWGAPAQPPHRSEEPFMTSGSGRPGQAPMGQRSIFGTGRGPVVAQMPSYTPVTRGPEPQPQHVPEPPKPDSGAYARQNGVDPRSLGHSNQNGAAPSYQAPGNPGRNYTAPDFPNPFPPMNYQPQQPSYQPQGYQAEPAATPNRQMPSQPAPMQPIAQPARAYQPQSRPAPMPQGFQSGNGYQQPEPPAARSFADNGFPERIFPAEQEQNSGFVGQNYGEPNYSNASFGDASFPDSGFGDASFQDASFPEEQNPYSGTQDYSGAPSHADTYSEHEPMQLDDAPTSYADDSGHDPYAGHAGRDYVRPMPAHQALQTFDAGYDQPPHIALGGIKYPHQNEPQGFYDADQGDADFLDESQFMTPGEEPVKPAGKFGLKSRSIFMVGSALLGAVALGGALAFAYKQSGGTMGGGAQPPLVQADSRPVKEAPEQAGSKDTPHKNKLIYERLQNGDQPEAEHIVPRQEDVAMPALPGSAPMAAPQPAPGAPPQVATVDDPNAADGGPRRVKTLIVRPDGSVTPPAVPPAQPQQAAPAQAAPPQQMAAAEPAIPPMPMPQDAAPAQAPAPAPAAEAAPPPAAPAPQPVAADPQPVAAIPAKPKAAAADAAQAPAKPSQYVVQVGSKQNQTEALATFADMQQKYPTLLASYRPMVQKADLGAKGVWYRLRIGPIVDKTAATKLCTQLKSQGHADCLVMAAQ